MEITEEIRYYTKLHVLCPKCKGNYIAQTVRLVPKPRKGKPFEDKENDALCRDCDWSGKVYQLKPETK